MTVSKVLERAKAEVGYCESPAGSNKTKYGVWYGWNGVAWCMIFIQYLFKHLCDMSLPLVTAGCTSFMNYCKEHYPKRMVYKNYQPGDIVLFDFDNDPKEAEHVGIVVRNDGTSLQCIEGNTSITSNDNGGKVMQRTRYAYQIICGYRPEYDDYEYNGSDCEVLLSELSEGCKGNEVTAMQILLIGHGFSCGEYGADGDFGNDTKAAVLSFQNYKKIDVDGICGQQTWTKLLK